ERARERRLPIVGAWLALDVDPTPLMEAGFTRGWSPWWMTADLDDVVGEPDPRVELQIEANDYQHEDPGIVGCSPWRVGGPPGRGMPPHTARTPGGSPGGGCRSSTAPA